MGGGWGGRWACSGLCGLLAAQEVHAGAHADVFVTIQEGRDGGQSGVEIRVVAMGDEGIGDPFANGTGAIPRAGLQERRDIDIDRQGPVAKEVFAAIADGVNIDLDHANPFRRGPADGLRQQRIQRHGADMGRGGRLGEPFQMGIPGKERISGAPYAEDI